MSKYKFKEIFKKFPNINEELILNFYNLKKSDRINPTKSLNQINDWLLKFKIDINSLSAEDLVNYHEKRCLRLIYGNLNHPSVIDLGLFEIYAPTKEIAKEEYENYKINKTKNMIKAINDSPESRKGASLSYQQQKHGEDLGKIKHNEFIKKQKNSSKRCKEYWILQGFTEEEASKKVSEAQTTFSLKICIEKYGEEEGYKIWKERQDKWQIALNSKSQYEKILINKKKNIYNIQSYILRGFSEEESLILLNNNINNTNRTFSTECINFIEKNFTNLDGCLYGQNEWCVYDEEKEKISYYDFTNLDKKIIFEYHGEKFHPNTKILSEKELSEWRHIYSKQGPQKSIDKDLYKKQLAISLGFNYFEIYSNDPICIKNQVIREINELLNC